MKFRIIRSLHNHTYKYKLYRHDYDPNEDKPICVVITSIEGEKHAINNLKSKAQDYVSDHIVAEFEL